MNVWLWPGIWSEIYRICNITFFNCCYPSGNGEDVVLNPRIPTSSTSSDLWANLPPLRRKICRTWLVNNNRLQRPSSPIKVEGTSAVSRLSFVAFQRHILVLYTRRTEYCRSGDLTPFPSNEEEISFGASKSFLPTETIFGFSIRRTKDKRGWNLQFTQVDICPFRSS